MMNENDNENNNNSNSNNNNNNEKEDECWFMRQTEIALQSGRCYSIIEKHSI